MLEPARKPLCSPFATKREEIVMGKGILLWLIGIPIPVILILFLIFR